MPEVRDPVQIAVAHALSVLLRFAVRLAPGSFDWNAAPLALTRNRSNSSTASTTTTGRPCLLTTTGSDLAISIRRPKPYLASFADMLCMVLPSSESTQWPTTARQHFALTTRRTHQTAGNELARPGTPRNSEKRPATYCNSAERNLTAVMAVPDPGLREKSAASIGSSHRGISRKSRRRSTGYAMHAVKRIAGICYPPKIILRSYRIWDMRWSPGGYSMTISRLMISE
jgi:hypothetical protein